MKRKLTLVAALALSVGLIAAGCGDDDDSGDTGTESTALTHAQFVDEANAICEQGNSELQEAGPNGPDVTEDDLNAFVTDTLVPTIQGMVDDISALDMPEEDQETFDGIATDTEEVLDELEADPSSIADGDPFADVNKELAALGLTTCANG